MTAAHLIRNHSQPQSATTGAVPSGAGVLEPVRIAVYTERYLPPHLVDVPTTFHGDDDVATLIGELATQTYNLARDQGGRLSFDVIHELVENLIHASFRDVVITILDRGNTIRISDRGSGIPDKEAALRVGFTSADAHSRRVIRGVGSGLALVAETMRAMDGALHIEDNLGTGTVVTISVKPDVDAQLAPVALPAYNLAERQLKVLLLTVELAPVGPSRIARELGVSTSTAYRDLIFLEEAGFVISEATGHRSVTEAGLVYLNTLL